MKKNKLKFNKKIFEINSDISNNIAIAVKNISKKYSKQKQYTLTNIEFNILKGQFHALIGSNGAGKTTTIKIIIGAIQKFAGSIYINQISNESADVLAKIAYIPEMTSFPTQMSLKEFLEWNGRMIGLKGKKLNQEIDKILEKLNLKKFVKKNPENFSSGEQKKVLLAQALLKRAEIFVMDEPTTNLDPQTRFELLNFMKKLQQEGKTILISSHILSEIEEYADSVTIIENGKVKISGSISNFSEKEKQFYHLIPISEKLLLNFLKNSKIPFIKSNEKFSINFKSEKNFINFLKVSSKKDVFFKHIEKIELGLKDIYTKHVLKDNQKMH